MSRTVDNRVVEMEFDNARFEKNVSQSLSTLDKLKAALSFKGVTDDFSSVERATEKLGQSFSAMEAVAFGALTKLGSQITDWAERTIRELSGVQNVMEGFNKFSAITKSSATMLAQGFRMKEINREMKELNWFTDETSYSLTGMVDNISKFTASGKGLHDSVKAMEGIALWGASAGQNAETVNRAMYQLSQAMSAGVMRKEDWRSVQNANMDIKEFREHALEAAVALGTLKKNADGTFQSIVDGVSGAGKESFTVSQFAEHLTEGQWFTSDVMMKVYQDYAKGSEQIYNYIRKHTGATVQDAIDALGDSLDEFGKKVFLAGQAARTWEDAIDSVKDALSTKWEGIFEHIFGNANQATKFFTDLSYAFYDIFVEPMSGLVESFHLWRNAFGRTEWQGALIDGLYALNDVINTVRNTFDKFLWGDRAEKLVEKTEFLRNRLVGKSEDWELTGEIKQIDKARKGLAVFNTELGSDGIVEARGQALLEFTHKLRSAVDTFMEWSSDLQIFERLLNGVFSIFGIASQAVKGFFSAILPFKGDLADLGGGIIEFLANVADKIHEFYQAIKTNNTFGKVFKTLFQPLYNLRDAIRSFLDELIPRLKEKFDDLKKSGEGLSEGFGKVKDALKSVFDKIVGWWERLFTNFDAKKAVDGLFNAFDKLKAGLYELLGIEPGTLVEHVSELFDKIQNKINQFKDSAPAAIENAWKTIKGWFSTAFSWIEENWSSISKTIQNIWGGVWGFISGVWEGVKSVFKKDGDDSSSSLESLAETFKTIGEVIGKASAFIGKALKPLADGLKNTFENMDLEGLGDAAGGTGLALIGGAIIKFAKDLKQSNILIGLNEIFKSFGDVLNSFAHYLDAKALKEVAIAIGIIVGSLFVLISLPTDQLASAVTVLSIFLAILAQSLKKLSGITSSMKVNGKGLSWDKNSGGMMFLEVATGLLLIAFAFRIIAKIPTEDLYTALFVISVMVAVVSQAIKAIAKLYGDKGDKSVNKFWSGNTTQMSNNSIIKVGGPAATILAFALMIGVVALTIKGIAGMIEHNLGSFVGALAVVGVLIAAIVLATKQLGSVKYDKGQKGVSGMLIALSLAIALMAVVLAGLTMLVDKYGGRKVTIAAGIVAGIVMIFALFAVAADKADTTKIKKLMGGMLVLAIAVGLMAGVVYLLAQSDKDIVTAALVVGGISALFGILIGLAGSKLIKEDTAKKLTKLSAALLIFSSAVAVMAGVIYVMAQLKWEDLAKGAVAILAITAAFAILIGISYVTGDAVVKLGKAFLMIGGTLALLAIGALAMVKAMEILSGDTIDAAALAETVDSIIQNVVRKLPTWLEQIVSSLIETWLMVKFAVIDAAIQTVLDIVDKLLENDTITKLVNGVSQVIIKACDAIAENAGPVVNSVGNALLAILSSLAGWLDSNWAACSAALKGLIDGIIKIVLGLFTGLGGDIYDQTAGELKPELEGFKGYIDGTWLQWVAMVAGAIIAYFNPVLGILTAILGLFGAVSQAQIKNAQLAELSPLNDYYQKKYISELDPTDPLYQQKVAEASQKGYEKAVEMQAKGYGVENGALVKYNKGPKGTVIVDGSTKGGKKSAIQVVGGWTAKGSKALADQIGNGIQSGDTIILPKGQTTTNFTQNVYNGNKVSESDMYRQTKNLLARSGASTK